MATYRIMLEKTKQVEVEAETYEEAILEAKKKLAYNDFDDPNNYCYVGGYKLPEDYN